MAKTISQLDDFNLNNNNINNMLLCIGNGRLNIAKLKQKILDNKDGSIEMRLSSNLVDEDDFYYYILLDGSNYIGTKYEKVHNYLPTPLPNLVDDVYALAYNPNNKNLINIPKFHYHNHTFDEKIINDNIVDDLSSQGELPSQWIPFNNHLLGGNWASITNDQGTSNRFANISILSQKETLIEIEGVDYIVGDNLVENPYIVISKVINIANKVVNVSKNLNILTETSTLLSEDNYILDDGEITDTKQISQLLGVFDYKIGSIIYFPIGKYIEEELSIETDLLIYKYKKLDSISQNDVNKNHILLDTLQKLGYDNNFPKLDNSSATYFAISDNQNHSKEIIESHICTLSYKADIEINSIIAPSKSVYTITFFPFPANYITFIERITNESSLLINYSITLKKKIIAEAIPNRSFERSLNKNHETGYINVVPYICISIEIKPKAEEIKVGMKEHNAVVTSIFNKIYI